MDVYAHWIVSKAPSIMTGSRSGSVTGSASR
jgi:hypothetical protein